MRRPELLLELLRDYVKSFPELELPETTAERVSYIRNLSEYDTELSTEIANACLAYSITDEVLVELVGRYRVLSYYLSRLDGMGLDAVSNIRKEIRKRKSLHKSLVKMLYPRECIPLVDFKVLLSALMRVVIEFEKEEKSPLSLKPICMIIFDSVTLGLSKSNCELLSFLFGV